MIMIEEVSKSIEELEEENARLRQTITDNNELVSYGCFLLGLLLGGFLMRIMCMILG